MAFSILAKFLETQEETLNYANVREICNTSCLSYMYPQNNVKNTTTSGKNICTNIHNGGLSQMKQILKQIPQS